MPSSYTAVDFSEIFSFTYDFFRVLYTSAILLWRWFSTEVDSSTADLIGVPLGTTYLELVFGSILIGVLVYAVTKYFVPFG